MKPSKALGTVRTKAAVYLVKPKKNMRFKEPMPIIKVNAYIEKNLIINLLSLVLKTRVP